MSETLLRIETAAGRRVRDELGVLLTEAVDVILSSFWQRRLDDGDVVPVKAKKESGE